MQTQIVDAKFKALQIVAIMARDFVGNLKPGDRFLGVVPEAAKHFDVGSEGYNMFVNCAMFEFDGVAMDVDGQGRIISLVRAEKKRRRFSQ